jgi:hypothetical protein
MTWTNLLVSLQGECSIGPACNTNHTGILKSKYGNIIISVMTGKHWETGVETGEKHRLKETYLQKKQP